MSGSLLSAALFPAALLRTALRRSQTQIWHVSPVPASRASGLCAAVYRQVERDFGMLAPPVSLHAAAPGPLAACWLMLRETLVVPGLAGRAVKEEVAAAVSAGNACPYCVQVHSATLQGLARGAGSAGTPVAPGAGPGAGPPWAAGAGVAGAGPDADPGTRRVAEWARASGTRELAAGQDWPFPAALAPEIVGVAVTFHYLNRMVSVFLGDGPLPPQVPAVAREGMMRVLGRFMGRAARQPIEPGAALGLLPDAAVPEELAWMAGDPREGGDPKVAGVPRVAGDPRVAAPSVAGVPRVAGDPSVAGPSVAGVPRVAGDPRVAGAFARATAAIEAAAQACVPAGVRELVLAQLAGWGGQPPGPGRDWLDGPAERLPPAQRAAGRLAMLTAMAAYQVVPADIAAFRLDQPDDAALISLTSWASLAAALRVASWLGPAAR